MMFIICPEYMKWEIISFKNVIWYFSNKQTAVSINYCETNFECYEIVYYKTNIQIINGFIFFTKKKNLRKVHWKGIQYTHFSIENLMYGWIIHILSLKPIILYK